MKGVETVVKWRTRHEGSGDGREMENETWGVETVVKWDQ